MASKEYHRAWRAANPDKVKAIRERFEAAHPNYRQESLNRDPARIERQKERQAAWQRANRDKRNAQQAASAARRRAFLAAYKLERGCIDCGYRGHPAALEFDHRDPAAKEFTISLMFRTTMKRLLAELGKCDIRCANCHAVRTHEENHSGIRKGVVPDAS